MLTIITSNYNTNDFLNPLEESIQKNTKMEFNLIIGTPQNQIISSKYGKIITHKINEAQGSKNHGLVLNQLIKEVKTKFCLIIDIDCFIILKDWDELLIPLLSKYRLIGAEAFRVDKITKTRLLHANFLLGYTDDFKNINFCPDFSRNVDTAGFLSIQLKDQPILELKHMNPTLYFNSVHCAEYQYDNKIIYYHYGRGASLRGGIENKKNWQASTRKYLNNDF